MKRRNAIPGNAPTLAALALLIFVPSLGCTQQADDEAPAQKDAIPDEPRMTAERLGEIIQGIDEEAIRSGSAWIMTVEGLETTVVYDELADRMRIVIPIGPVEGIEEEQIFRMMQANFDSALDARYAIAQGMLWGTYIHPLSTLDEEEFLLGLFQTMNVVLTYGTSYSSGMFNFGGGDSAQLQLERWLEEQKRSEL